MKPSALDQEQASWSHLQAQIRLTERQARWEPWKALAAILAAAALISAAILALSNWHQPQTIVVRFEQPFAVKLQP